MTRNSTPIKLLLAVLVAAIPAVFTPAMAAEEMMDCESLREIIPETVTEWMSEGNSFHEDVKSLGWVPWSEQVLEEVGFPEATGYSFLPSMGDVPMVIPEKYHFDYLVWQAVDMNDDQIEDRLLVTSFLQGIKGSYHYGRHIFLFCGMGQSGNFPGTFPACGNINYRASLVGIGGIKSTVQTTRLETLVRGPQTNFTPLMIEGHQYFLASATGWETDTEYAIAADLWSFENAKPVRLLSCAW